ncbi:zinc-dependent alcohol dehydrogenase [Compostimonas suwonensis]|uniref:2-desacetyl-2-hydroxyethyl bacteriochlorophyllide A dehydrogenase n=1 Tax=Compostimonas suwonensis TaxID=1048394 RepID=A0A2M9BBP7_9MICO|nr:alcohol dehydrogenase catalytic domain-containing protein [Compostimonas suwonensis]PJJ55363.1 2-desacetyl-2-hydroxyethyl bacteriochlorophyllide A dehydrogenase [Compostimonas suwonensis]
MLKAEYVRGAALEIMEGEPPVPAAGQVVIRVSHVGICGTDLHLLHGAMDHRTGPRRVIGHEASGIVVAKGADVDVELGAHVAFFPLVPCGQCPACLAGNGHICQRLVFLGIDGPGALQQEMVVDASLIVPIDPSVPERHGALVEPTAVAVHDVRRAGLTAGDVALVVGGGPIGALIAVVARHEGATVLVVELDPFRQSVLRDLGFEVLDPREVDVKALVWERTGGAGADVAFEVSGAEAGIATAIDAIKVRGTLGLVAVHTQPRSVDLHQFFWRELTLVGSRLYVRGDFERAAELLAQGVVPADALISRIVPLAQAQSAVDALFAKEDVMKVLVACND